MGATEEQLDLLSDLHVTHVSYILILYSVAFLLFLFVIVLLHIYAQHAWPAKAKNNIVLPPTPTTNGHIRDVEEFELEGLITDDEEDRTSEGISEDSGTGRRKEVRN